MRQTTARAPHCFRNHSLHFTLLSKPRQFCKLHQYIELKMDILEANFPHLFPPKQPGQQVPKVEQANLLGDRGVANGERRSTSHPQD